MRIAISADNNNGLDAVVSPHFGRCPFFAVVEVEGNGIKGVQSVQNPFYAQHQPGQVPAFIRSLNVDVMLTGGMGGRAVQIFQQYGIEPVTGAAGTARYALEQYLRGRLRGFEPCRESMAHGHGDVPHPGAYERDEVGRLREEAEMLRRELQEVEERLRQLG